MTQNFREVYEFMSSRFEKVNGEDFYREIFPNNENSSERHNDFSHPNAVYYYLDEESKKLFRNVMYNDTWSQNYIDFVECNPMTLCGGLSYRRNKNKLEYAQKMNALIFDIDDVGFNEINTLFLRFGGEPNELRRLPMPTYIVLSGLGVHIYYLFDEAIDLYPNIKIQLKSLKYDLTFKMWDYKSTSKKKNIEYQSINQGFRMVGSSHEAHGNVVTAFRVGEPVSLEYLNAYVQPQNRVDINRRFSTSKVDVKTVKELYPEWYQRVVIEGNKKLKKWDIKGKQGYALYDWWLRQIHKAKGGHRYFYLMCLAIYACKCDVPKSKLVEDMEKATVELNKIEYSKDGQDDPVKQSDIISALEAYNKEYYNFTINDIEKLSEIPIERNKRNGRKRKTTHQIYRRGIKRLKVELGESDGWDKGGRPSAEVRVREWQQLNPQGRKVDCIRALNLSKPTVYKWWNL